MGNQLDLELNRLRQQLAQCEHPDPVDAAVVGALSNDEVRRLLLPILDSGAALKGVSLDAAGTTLGIAVFGFETEWTPGTSHVGPPPRVVALVELKPFRMLKVTQETGDVSLDYSRFVRPEGIVPPTLRNMGAPCAEAALQAIVESNRVLVAWLQATSLDAVVARKEKGKEQNGGGGGHVGGVTTGGQCSSLMCMEHYPRDLD